MPAHIRPASPDDAEALVSVTHSAVRGLSGDYYTQEEREAWIEGVSEEAMRKGLRDTDTETFIAEIETQTVGFSTLQENYVRAVYVRPDAQGQGIGSDLLHTLEKTAERNGIRALEVAASLHSVEFYESHGYEKVSQSNVELVEGLEIRCIEMTKKFS